MEIDSYIIIITIIGLAALGMAWMPSIARYVKISYSIMYVLAGALLYLIFGRLLPLPDPISKNTLTLHMTELVVIISLMGTGLKIDQPFTFKTWAIPFKLVSITMLLSIGIVTLISYYILNFSISAALLLGAVLAPTDPVLASDVQVEPPMQGARENVKFSLTAEAGLNDGTAFPFTWLAIIFAIGSPDLEHWVAYYLIYKILAGAVVGFLLGKALAYLLFILPQKYKYIKVKDGFVAISATLLVYGLAEMVKGYGFIAVFVTAITLRNFELNNKYHRIMHEFIDQVERILVAVVLILFGGSLVTGILDSLTWQMVVFSLAFVLIIRPFTSIASVFRNKLHVKEKLAISFFGIKGMGSFFYLAFALQQASFGFGEQLWAVGAFVVLLSVIIHGFTATSVMQKLETDSLET